MSDVLRRPSLLAVQLWFVAAHYARFFSPHASCQTIFTFSGDKAFRAVGETTRINYHDHYTFYQSIIATGLQRGHAQMLELLALWNRVVFGLSEADLEADSDDTGEALDAAMGDMLRVKAELREQVTLDLHTATDVNDFTYTNQGHHAIANSFDDYLDGFDFDLQDRAESGGGDGETEVEVQLDDLLHGKDDRDEEEEEEEEEPPIAYTGLRDSNTAGSATNNDRAPAPADRAVPASSTSPSQLEPGRGERTSCTAAAVF